MRISDWSSDVCSSDLTLFHAKGHLIGPFVTVSMFALRREMVFLQQVENGNPAFLLNISIAPDDGLLVERNIYDARIGHWSSPLRGLRGKDQRQKTIHNLCPIYPQACRQRRGACLLSPWRNAPMIGHGREYKTDYPAGRGGKKPASQYRGGSRPAEIGRAHV